MSHVKSEHEDKTVDSILEQKMEGQDIFTRFLEADAQKEKEIQEQITRIDQAGQRILDAINKI